MDIEKLIEQLNEYTQSYTVHDDPDLIDTLKNSATALSTLQAKNEKLRAEVEQERAHRIHAEQHADAFQKDCERLNAELERVTAERDGAVRVLETDRKKLEIAFNVVVNYGFCGNCRWMFEDKHCLECDCYQNGVKVIKEALFGPDAERREQDD